MKFTLGTAQFGNTYGISNITGKTKENQVKKIINYAEREKVKFIELADNYNNIKKIVKLIKKKEFKIIYKIKITKNFSKKSIHNKLKSFLKLINKKNVYAILIHNINNLNKEQIREVFKIFQFMKEKKLVKKFGFSSYSFSAIKKIIMSNQINKPNFLQVPLNIFDQSFTDKKKIFFLKKKNNIEIHIRSIFLQGLLLIQQNKLKKYFRKWRGLFKKFEKKKDISKLNSKEICIAFIKQNLKKFDSITLGVNSYNELKELMILFKKKNNKKINFKNLNSKDKNIIYPYLWKI